MAARRQTKALHRARLGRTRFLGEVVAASTAYLQTSDVDVDVDVQAPDGILAGLMGMVDASIIWWLDVSAPQASRVTCGARPIMRQGGAVVPGTGRFGCQIVAMV
jgi:hypothetical protein